MIPNKPSYSHGSTGTKPSSSIDYATGDPLNADEFDYFIYTEFNSIKKIIDTLNAIDSDDDGTVDEADSALTYKGNDIDSDGDGSVDSADSAYNATNVTATYKGNDIDSNGDGTVDEADNANAYKNNDIDSDGDGIVDEADSAKAYKHNDIDSDGDGKVDSAESADAATNVTATYKGNDIDSNGDGKVDAADDADTVGGEPPSNFADSGDAFVASSPVDKSGSRNIGTQYTNSTGGPIKLYVILDTNGDDVFVDIDGTSVYKEINSDSEFFTVDPTVPDGSTYRVHSPSGSPTLDFWHEQNLTP